MSARPQNRCSTCGATWFPRGQNLSRECPACGSPEVGFLPEPPRPRGGNTASTFMGTLLALVVFFVVGPMLLLGACCGGGLNLLFGPSTPRTASGPNDPGKPDKGKTAQNKKPATGPTERAIQEAREQADKREAEIEELKKQTEAILAQQEADRRREQEAEAERRAAPERARREAEAKKKQEDREAKERAAEAELARLREKAEAERQAEKERIRIARMEKPAAEYLAVAERVLKRGETDKAIARFKEIVKDYPGTKGAARAAERLKELEK